MEQQLTCFRGMLFWLQIAHLPDVLKKALQFYGIDYITNVNSNLSLLDFTDAFTFIAAENLDSVVCKWGRSN